MKKFTISMFCILSASSMFAFTNFYDYQNQAEQFHNQLMDNLNLPKRNEIYMQDNRGNAGTLSWFENTGPTARYLDHLFGGKGKTEALYEDNSGYSSTLSWFE